MNKYSLYGEVRERGHEWREATKGPGYRIKFKTMDGMCWWLLNCRDECWFDPVPKQARIKPLPKRMTVIVGFPV